MFNLQGSEIIVILLLALVVLGPEKLPDAVRKFTQTYAELKKLGSGFQSELKSALDEPMREMRETAEVVRDAADPARISAEAEAEKRLRDDAANAQVHHLAPFTASADLPGAETPGPDPDVEVESEPDDDGSAADAVEDDEHDVPARGGADRDDVDDGEARTA